MKSKLLKGHFKVIAAAGIDEHKISSNHKGVKWKSEKKAKDKHYSERKACSYSKVRKQE